MTLDAVLAGIEILRKYTKTEYPLDAQHDVLFFLTHEPVSDEDRAKLDELGWRLDPVYPGDGIWSCFV